MSEQTYGGHTLAEIKAVAELAQPMPWEKSSADVPHRAKAEFIATTNPATVLAMAARIEELERERDKLREDYEAQGLALKASKAMQLAETQRADAAEQDAERWRALWDAVDEGRATAIFMGRLETIHTGLEVCTGGDLTDEVGILIEQTKNREGV